MRRNFSAILILSVFLSLQFGKVATYLYCKWQMVIVQNQPDCGCDDHLLAMFDHNVPGENGTLTRVNLNEKVEEYSLRFLIIDLSVITLPEKNCFAEYNSPLSKSFIVAPFHPPAV